MDKGISFSN